MTDNTNVNVAPAQTPQWVNADGLRVKFGRGEAEQGIGGEYIEGGSMRHVSSLYVDYTVVALGIDDTHSVILDYSLVFPAGAVIERCEFKVTEAWDSTSNDVALNFGLLKRPAAGDTAYEIVDADGLMNTVAKTVIDLLGNTVVTESAGGYPDITTYAGVLMNTALAEDSVVSCYWENHAPTVGAGYLRIFWRDANKAAL